MHTDSAELSRYRDELRAQPRLDADAQLGLALRYQRTRDRRDADALARSNLPLVLKIATEYHAIHTSFADLVQEGNLGLLRAVEKFDPQRGVRFSTYAAHWIRAYVLRHLVATFRLVRIGTNQTERRLFFNLRKEERKLEGKGVAPGGDELARELGVSERTVVEMGQRLAFPELSLEAPVRAEERGGTAMVLGDVIPASESLRPDAQAEERELQALLRRRLASFQRDLRGRELAIFRERWLRDEPRTLKELGAAFGVTRERARQLEARLLDRLRRHLGPELTARG